MSETTTPTAPASNEPPATPPITETPGTTPPATPPQDPPPNPPPETIPYGRFSEEVAKRKELEKKLAEKTAADEAARQAKLVEDGKLQELLDEQKPKVERAAKLEAIVEKTVNDLIEKIPEERRSLVPPTLSNEDKLDYIQANSEMLMNKAAGATINQGTNPGGTTTSTKTFTTEQLKDTKFYRENRDEILLAQKEGRIKE